MAEAQRREYRTRAEINVRACGSPHVSRGAQAKLRTWVVLVGSTEGEILGVNEKGMWGLQKEMQMELPRDR